MKGQKFTKDEKISRELARLDAMWLDETKLSIGASFVFGIDEAGRGPLMGEVVAGCVVFPKKEKILYLNDSKKLSVGRREELFDEICSLALSYSVSSIGPEIIDKINILNATLLAFSKAFNDCLKKLGNANVSPSDSIVLVDGNKTSPGIDYNQRAVVSGDSICPSIAAASILAKVTRDRMMIEYDKMYPEYGFLKNKGYGTREHIEAIKKYGITPIHRKSFLKNIL